MAELRAGRNRGIEALFTAMWTSHLSQTPTMTPVTRPNVGIEIQIMGMRGALVRVLGEGNAGVEDGSMSESDVMGLVSQLREARSLLREQDAIMLAAIFDR